jgi:mono/diheme cytochrome c family protein/thiol-disulfide isomerase/thioredoxin
MSPHLPVLLLAALALSGADRAPPARLDFRLSDPRDDSAVAFGDLKDNKAVVIVFVGTECPLSNAFVPVLAALHKEYAPRGVAFLGVNANRQDTPDRVAAHAREHGVPFPVLKDVGNRLADRLEARRTPEAVVLDPAGHVLYRGRIDDQFGIGYVRPGKPTRRDLAAALDEVLAGRPVSVPATPVAGCLIGRVVQPREQGAVTYARQISRILQANCQECHRPGQIGPMALLSYDDAVAWADTIREVIDERRMPPWHADPRFGKFSNDRRLSEADRAALLAWLDGGLPRGDDRDLPPPRDFPAGWRIGKPDVVLTMSRDYAVPAKMPVGGIPYRYFTVDPGFKEDRWVERAEARPDATAVVHHMVVYIVPEGEVLNPEGPGSLLCGTAPGDMPLILPPGYAKKVPAGAKLVFQMHYTPNGKPYKDRSSVGIVFAREPPRQRVLTKPIHNPSFVTRQDRIPAGAEDYRMEAEHVFKKDGHILGFMPHMHLRGKDFLYEAVYPDGKSETLLSVPHYQFGWQSVYRCVAPVAVPKGTHLHCVAHFDNSAKNPNNPDPTRPVYWGDQTWEEMMLGWIEYYYDAEKP